MVEEEPHQSTPPTVQRPILSLSSSMSPPTTPNRQRVVGWWQSSVVRRSSSAVDEAVDELTEKSRFLLRATTPRRTSTTTTTHMDSPLESDEDTSPATFDREEILAGALLGEGTFSSVYEVVGFSLHDQDDPLRNSLAHANPSRFALKHLKASLLDDTLQFEQAATDLVMEAKYMAALNHPNILKMHGEPRNGTAAINNGVDGYFLLTDRLSETLAQRIERWKLGQDAETNTVPCKLNYALQIAQALLYLHQQRILFRDLKPSNIGFHQEDPNRIQLFDFGLCRELPPRKDSQEYSFGEDTNSKLDASEYSQDLDESWEEDREEVYFMSGAGTQIYMAPEVLTHNRYNLKADVYSWSMTVTELLLLEKPLPIYELDEHIQYVCVEGDRPALEGHDEIPDSVRDLLAWAWEPNVAKRCSMAQICNELPDLLADWEPVTFARTDGWPSRVWHLVRRIPRYLLSLMGRALERVSCFFIGCGGDDAVERAQSSSRDVTFDLPQEKREPDPSLTNQTEGSNSSDHVFLSPRPAPPRVSRSALLKRKPSSASTTAMTDDELDDDDYLGFSPISAVYNKPPPMEALVERHNSAISTAS